MVGFGPLPATLCWRYDSSAEGTDHGPKETRQDGIIVRGMVSGSLYEELCVYRAASAAAVVERRRERESIYNSIIFYSYTL